MIPSAGSNGGSPAGSEHIARKPRMHALIITLVALAAVLLPFFFWQGTWFGRKLSHDQIREYLASEDQPRKTQHALVQLIERIADGDSAAKQHYAAVVRLASSEHAEIRNTIAWLMGYDNSSGEFRSRLLDLIHDPVLSVRQNAALALTNFHDDTGRDIILAMLEPEQVLSPKQGKLIDVVHVGAPVKTGSKIGAVAGEGGLVTEVKSPIDGKLEKSFASVGAQVADAQPLCAIAPGIGQVQNALAALLQIGRPDDIPAIQAVANRRSTNRETADLANRVIVQIKEREDTAP